MPRISSSRAVWLLVAVGFVARLGLAIALGLNKPPEPGSDPEEYDTYAWNVTQGRGYRGMSPDVADRDHLTAYRPPGTSLVWAGFYSVFGHRYDVIRILHCVAGALSVWVLFRIGLLCFSERISLLAAAVYAVFPTALLSSTELMAEALGILYFLGFIWSSLDFARRPSWARSAIAGMLLGLGILTRANFVVMLPLILLWIVWQFRFDRKAMVQALLIPTLAVASLIPWTARNYLVFHEFIPLSTMGGSVLLQGNNDLVANVPELYGYNIWDTRIPEYSEALQNAGNEVERDRRAKEFAVQWLTAHPEKWGYLVRMKLWRSITPFLQPNSPWHYRVGMLVAWGPVLLLCLPALPITFVQFIRARHPGWLVHLCILHFVLLSLAFFGLARYRQPVEPLCILLASWTVVTLFEWVRTQRNPSLSI
ncbi:MAG: ArnT family glycosyltransferase [Planctomycetaceae bacterium]